MVTSLSFPFKVTGNFCFSPTSKSALFFIITSFLYFGSIVFVPCTNAMQFEPQNFVQVSTTSQTYFKTKKIKLDSQYRNFGNPILEIDAGGHKAKINDLIFTSDGRYLVSSSNDKTVRVTDVQSGEVVWVIRGQMGEGFEGMIYATALSPDDKILAIGGWLNSECPGQCGDIRLINFQTGETLRLLKGHPSVILDLAFSLDGRYLISGSFDHSARIWEMSTGRSVHVLTDHTNKIYSVAFSPDGSLAVTGSHDHTLKVWDVSTGAVKWVLKGHMDKVHSTAFTPDGRYLLSGSWDKTIRLWDAKTGAFIKILGIQGSDLVSLSISPDSKTVLTGAGSPPYINNVFSIPSGKRLTRFSKHNSISLATAISPNGSLAATGGGEAKEIYTWDLKTGRIKQKFFGKGNAVFSVGFSEGGHSIAWGKKNACPGGSCLPLIRTLEQSFKLKNEKGEYHIKLGKPIASNKGFRQRTPSIGNWSVRTKSGKPDSILNILNREKVIHQIFRDSHSGYNHNSLTLSLDGKTTISGGSNGYLASYYTASGKLIHNFIGHTAEVWALVVSSDNRQLVSASEDQTVRLWDLATGKPLLTIFHGSDNEWVAWTPEGFYDASPNGDRYVGWRVNRGYDKAAEYYKASQFRRYLYRPDIIRDTLELSSSEEAVKKAGMEHITVADLIQRAPVDVSIASTRVLDSGEAEIDIKLAKNRTTVPERITLYVNGAQVLTQSQRQLAGVEPGDTLTYTAFLPKNRNHLRVLVENQWAENGDETWVEGTRLSEKDQLRGTLFVNAIGVGRYPKLPANQQLDSPPLDAFNFSQQFKSLEGNLYKRVIVNLLSDENGELITSSNIESLLKQQTDKAGPEDTTIVFLAGHGITDAKGDYQFLTADSKLRVVGKRFEVSQPGTSFDWSRLHKVLDRTLGKRIVIIDTCEAGEVLNVTHTDIQKLVKDIHDVNAIIYTGTSRQEIGLEVERGGIFTLTILDGIEGEANYRDGNLMFTDLRNYVDQEVPKRNMAILQSMNTRGILKVKENSSPNLESTQNPVAVVPKGMDSFIIYQK